MNKYFRVIWSMTQNCMIVVPELVRTGSRRSGPRQRRHQNAACKAAMALLVAAMLEAGLTGQVHAEPARLALPQNGHVAAGKAQIGKTGPGTLVVDQHSNRAVINWGSFDIGRDASVDFRQPSASSIALNRVQGVSASQINGQLTANGQVWISNKRGVYFGKDARVDVGGLVATTHAISDQSFMSGGARFTRGGATGGVVNEGRLTANDQGYIALMAPEVRNKGVIVARKGTVALAAGETVELEFDEGAGHMNVRVEAGQIESLVENGHLIEAPGGQVIMTAGAANAIRSGVVRNSGTVNATGISRSGGRIFLGGGKVRTTANSRLRASTALPERVTLDSSARPVARPEQAQIHIDSGAAILGGSFDASGHQGGTIAVEGDHITLTPSARLSAAGLVGGGNVLIGGDWQGGSNPDRLIFASSDAMREARNVTMSKGARIDASAILRGDGGRVVLWSDTGNDASVTRVGGHITARGGMAGGDGGAIETSGHRLFTTGASGSAAAPAGKAGEWLFDPTNITVTNDATTGDGVAGATVTSGEIARLLNSGTSVTLTADQTLTWSAGAKVSVRPPSEVSLNMNSKGLGWSNISFSTGSKVESTGAPLNFNISMQTQSVGQGAVVDLSGLTAITNGGDFTVSDHASYGGGAALYLGPNTTIKTGVGHIALAGTTYKTNGAEDTVYGVRINGATLSTTDGDISIQGTLKGNNIAVGSASRAVAVNPGTQISTAGSGNITITGTKPAGNVNSLYLVEITGTAKNTSISSGGTLDIVSSHSVGANRALLTKDVTLSAASDLTIDALEQSDYNWSYTIENTEITSGGDVMISAASSELDIEGTSRITTQGTGDVTIRTDTFTRPNSPDTLTVNTTGHLTIEPFNASYPATFTFGGTMSGGNLVGTSSISGLVLNDIANMGGLTLGKEGNNANMALTGNLSLPGTFNVYGGAIDINGNLTSFGDGDILLRSTSGGNQKFHLRSGKRIVKSGGAGTLTMKGNARIFLEGGISTTNGGTLNTVLWSDFDGDDDDGGVSLLGTVSTGGGHVWIGGSDTAGGSSIWNGLTVGNGPSIGTTGFNNNAVDLYGDITTDGGDVLVWAGNGYNGAYGISTDTDGSTIRTGSGNVTLITDRIAGAGSNLLVVDSTGHLTIAPDGGAFVGTFDWNHNNNDTLTNFEGPQLNWLGVANLGQMTGLTIGRYDGMSGVTIDNSSNVTFTDSATLTGPISIHGGNIALNNAVTATGDTISVTSDGTVTQTAALTASGLSLNGTGAFTLTHAGNAIGTIAAGTPSVRVGRLAFVNSGALDIGAVGATRGISASGDVKIETLSGNLNIAQSVTTTSTTANAVLLNAGRAAAAGTATGGNITVADGATVTAGGGGSVRLLSGSVTGSTGLTGLIGTGSGRFRYNSDETVTNYTTALPAGEPGAIYREAVLVSGAIDNNTVTYGDATPVFTMSGGSGPMNGDDLFEILSPQLSGAALLRVGSYSVSVGDFEGLGYTLGSITNGTLSVGRKALTISGLSGQDKAYDGTATATVLGTAALQAARAPGSANDGKPVSGDSVNLTGTAIGTFNSKDVTTANRVTFSGLSLTGSDASNYSLTPHAADTTSRITQRQLTLSASKTYDGTTSLAGKVSIGNLVGSETLTYSATASNAHVATAGKYIGSMTLANGSNGGLASNYRLPSLNSANAAVTINARTLAVSLTNPGVTKVYDGTTNAGADFVPTYSIAGLVSGDTAANLSDTGRAYNSANVVTAHELIVSGLSVEKITGGNGSQATDYMLDAPSQSIAATITPALLKVYANNDAKFVVQADAAGYAGVSYSGFVNGESVATAAGFVAPSVTRSTRGPDGNTGGRNSIAGTYTDQLTAHGGSADNYSFAYERGDFTILPSDHLLIRVTNLDTVYGTMAAYQPASVEYYDGVGIVRLDDGSIEGSSVTVDPNGRVVVHDGAGGQADFRLAPSGGTYSSSGKLAAGAYQLATTGTVTENSVNFSDVITVIGAHQVSAKAVTASTSSGVSKVYDGNADMTAVKLQLAGLESGDEVVTNGIGSYSDRYAGMNKSYTISGLTLGGTDAQNYYLSGTNSFSGTDGTITRKELTVNYQAEDKIYDGNRNAIVSGQSSDIVAGDLIGFSQAAALFADKNVGSEKSVTISGISLTGADAGNYALLNETAGTTASIDRLNEVLWIGGPSGDWFDPANWAGGAVPDLSNVANVIIPEGVNVTFGGNVVAPAQAGPVNVDSIGSKGSLTQTDGALNVGTGGITLTGFSQMGGTTMSSGDVIIGYFDQSDGRFTTDRGASFVVTDGFSQSGGGSVSVSGDAEITDSLGGTVLGNLSVEGDLSVSSTDGPIQQSGGSTIKIDGSTTLAAMKGTGPADITLGATGNDFGGMVQASGANITLSDINQLALGRVHASGALGATAGGSLELAGAVSADRVKLWSRGGDVLQTGGSLTVATGPSIISANGAVDLTRPDNEIGGSLSIDGGSVSIMGHTDGMASDKIKREIAAGQDTTHGFTELLISRTMPPKIAVNGVMPTGSAADVKGVAPSDAIRIELVTGLGQGRISKLRVAFASELLKDNSEFSFTLPEELTGHVAQAKALTIGLVNGGPLPEWLKFDPARGAFELKQVPPDAFPVEIIISADGKEIQLEMTQGSVAHIP
ncbi:MAG: YDG domain-containing protein [Paracoccaceae bacterium]